MNRRLISRVSALALFILLAWIAYTQNQTQPAQLTINKIKDGLFEIEGDGGNVAVLVTSEGVILVDDKYERDHDQIMDRVPVGHAAAGEVRVQHALSRGS